jgi:hypothetical protein
MTHSNACLGLFRRQTSEGAFFVFFNVLNEPRSLESLAVGISHMPMASRTMFDRNFSKSVRVYI